MPDLWMDVDTNLSEVPVNILPLLDDTDFKSREESVAYNAGGLELIWHFTTTAGATSATVVTPTTGGAYDWAHQDGGMYTIEIPASGGASINNNAEGFGWFTGVATGVLPWRGPIIGFRAAGLNNALIDDAYSATRGLAGTALPAAAADAAGGLPISDAGGLDLDAQVKTAVNAIKAKTDSLTFTVAGDVDCNVQTWKGSAAADMTGDAYARLGAPAGASVSADVAAVKSDSAAILVDTGTTLPGTLSTMDGKLDTIDNFIDTEVAAILEDTGTTLPATLATIEGKIDTADAVADAIKVVTDAIGATGSGLSAVPWNAAWDAEVQSECTDALNAYDPPTNAEMEARTLAAASYFDPAADTVAHVTLVDTTTTNTDMVSAAPSAASVADAVWDEAIAGHAGAGSAGAALSSASSAGDPWSTAIPGAYGAGTAGYVLGTQGATGSGLSAVPWNASWDAEVQSECTDALNAYDPPTKAELDAADDATLAAIAALSIPTATENADALLNRDMSAVSDTTARSPLNALRQLRNKVATAEGTMTVYKEDDATEAWIAALTTDASAEAITVVDPA
jgi:hypothetical protein